MTTTLRDRYLRTRFMVQKTIREYSEKPQLRAYLEILLTLFVISLFEIFAIRPTVITIGKLLQEIKAKEETLKTMNVKIDNLSIAKDLYTREGEKIKMVEEAIPNKPEPDILALQIEQLTKATNTFLNNMTIESTKILGEIPADDSQTLTLALIISGAYPNLINFAQEVENLRKPIKYDELKMSILTSKEGKILFLSLGKLSTPYSIEKKD